MDYWYQTAGDNSWLTLMHAQSIDSKTNISFICVICPRDLVVEESIHLVQVETEQISSLAIKRLPSSMYGIFEPINGTFIVKLPYRSVLAHQFRLLFCVFFPM